MLILGEKLQWTISTRLIMHRLFCPLHKGDGILSANENKLLMLQNSLGLAVKLLLGACHRKASIRTRMRLLYVGFGERNRYITQRRTAGDMKKYRTRTNDGVHNTHATNQSSILIMPKYVTLCFITFCYVHTSMEVISSPCYVVLASAYAYMIYIIHIYKRNLKHPQSSYTPESPISIVVNTHSDRNFEIPPNILTSVTWSVIERW